MFVCRRWKSLICGVMTKGNERWIDKVRGSSNQHDLCRWFVDNGYGAALTWVISKGCGWSVRTCRDAAQKGMWDAVRCIAARYPRHRVFSRYTGVLWRDHRRRLSELCSQKLADHRALWKTWKCATKAAHLDVLRWLRANGYTGDRRTCYLAARHGHLEILRWHVLECGCRLTKDTVTAAASAGKLEILQWVHESGYPLGGGVRDLASNGSHTMILEWLDRLGLSS